MDPLYTSACRGQSNSALCEELVKSATFGPTQLLGLTVLCGLLNHHVFSPSRLGALYGPKFRSLSREEQRRVGVLHVGILMKILAFVSLGTPAYLILVENRSWLEPAWPSGLRLSDMAIVSVGAFGALSLFDLIYSENLRMIYLLHHLGTLAWVHGLWAMFMALPAFQTAARFDQFRLICEISLSWILLSSLGSTVSRVIYLLRQFCPTGYSHLHRLFFGGFLLYSILLTLEAGLITYLTIHYYHNLPKALPPLIGVFQFLFTATKLKTTARILSVYRRQKGTSRSPLPEEVKVHPRQ
ncbi:hypothetical protein N7492_001906 [Penicillium capsulatum]|uniref:Uncharacterized protein n=1 Tax=Penicillium capsulatum TaxID=69766 RepID=A0A9W9IN26_9EURO|nr:hypothetical protein N7492_001906 [Penicillium capsulatum]KAJ6123471.1 hypothetical protein N7512_005936 [Penicillium capsulatum]